eukprot:g9695.t1
MCCKRLSCLAIVLIVVGAVVLGGLGLGLGIFFATRQHSAHEEGGGGQPSLETGPEVGNEQDVLTPEAARRLEGIREFSRQAIGKMTIRKAAAKPEFLLGPFGRNLLPGARALRLNVKISDCKDVERGGANKKYHKLRVLYAFDKMLGAEHVPHYCRSYGHTKTVVVGMWLVNNGGEPESESRRKFFNRFPMEDFLQTYDAANNNGGLLAPRPGAPKGTASSGLFYSKIMKKLETEELGLKAEDRARLEATGAIERVLLGHSNAGPGSLALFTSYPTVFKSAVLVDPAFCDASTRVMLQTAEVGANLCSALDGSQAAKDDAKSTAVLFAAIRNQAANPKPEAKAAYKKYWDYLDARAKIDEDDILALAKAGNKLPPKLQREYERTVKGLRSAFARNNARNMAWFLEDDTGRAGVWSAQAKAKAKKWATLRIRDATKNRLYRTDMLQKLRAAQEQLKEKAEQFGKSEQVGDLIEGHAKTLYGRKLIMSIGDALPRPFGTGADPGSVVGVNGGWETDNPFDWIPWQVYLWEHALREAKMPNLEVKDVIVVPGGHVPAVRPTIERVLKVAGNYPGKTMLDD